MGLVPEWSGDAAYHSEMMAYDIDGNNPESDLDQPEPPILAAKPV
jgi:hypothetical protein